MARKHFTSIVKVPVRAPVAPAAPAPAAAPVAAESAPAKRRGAGRPITVEAGFYHVNAKVKGASGATLNRIVEQRIGGCRSIREALDYVIESFPG